MIILSARRTWITLRKLRSIQATPVLAQTMIMALSQIDYSKINPRHFYSSQSEKIKFNWFAFELACEIDRAVPYKLKKYLAKHNYTRESFNRSCIELAKLLQSVVLRKLKNEAHIGF